MPQTRKGIVRGKVVLSIAVALFAVQFIGGCEEPTDPGCREECGSCNTQWDTKAQVCRDLGRNAIVPESCCGF